MANLLTLNGVKYPVLAQNPLPKGKRLFERRSRPTQASDAAIQEAHWKISGPMGQSQESAEGFLGVDHTSNLDHFNNGLLTSTAGRSTVTISGGDPATGTQFLPQVLPMLLGGFQLADISHIEEDRTKLVVGRGQAVSIVDASAMTLDKTHVKSENVAGMTVWRNKARLGFGPGREMETLSRFDPDSLSAEFIAESGQYALEMTTGTDRWWGISANQAAGDENELFYALDDWATFSNEFAVGDSQVPATGIGTIGPYTIKGDRTGAYSFTNNGKPVRVLESVRGYSDARNGASIAAAFGWLYITTALGLKATIPGQRENDVGPGAIDGYSGPSGQPRKVRFFKDSLWLIELVGSDTYVWRGRFGAQTADTGQPDWYGFRVLSSTTVDAIGVNADRTNPTLVLGEGNSTLSHYILAERTREIADSTYAAAFSTDGGTWFGSTLARNPNLHRNVRSAQFVTENCNGSNTWQLAVSVDEGSYVNIGSAVSSNGHQTLVPVSAGAPIGTVDFHQLKPRLTQVAASASAPPQIRGFLSVQYDERPRRVEQITITVRLGDQGRSIATDRAALEGLAGHGQGQPVAVQLPGEPSTTRYGFVDDVMESDLSGDGIVGMTISIALWETS